MNIREPIELLKEVLDTLKKAINNCTVSNYNTVSTNLNPLIEKYEKAIKCLETKETDTSNVVRRTPKLDISGEHYTTNSQLKKSNSSVPWQCNSCNRDDIDYCMNVCPTLKNDKQ